MDLIKLKYIADDTLKQEITARTYSDEFAGVYLHSGSPFVLKDHIHAIHSFRAYSEYIYPIYFFISNDVVTDDFSKLLSIYPHIKAIPIRTLDEAGFNNFSINELLYWVDEKHERLINVQSDGWIIKKGWEFKTNGYSWLGSKWKDPIKVIENVFNFAPVQIGNGGCNFRRRSKCLEVLDLVNKNGGQNIVKGLRLYENPTRERAGAFLSEDSFFCYFGFGAGIFEPVELDFIDSFAQEPITMETYLNKEKRPNLFHRID